MIYKPFFVSLRPQQWIKNLFIFLPLVFGKKLFIFPDNLKSVISFFLFSIAAGVVYLVNDIMDVEKDRQHPTKRLRPVASGILSSQHAWIAAIILGLISTLFSFWLNTYFGWTIIAYLIFNFIYTKSLKDMVIIDVFCIGGFFLLRIIAGSVVAEVEMSHWIVIMTVLLSLFLGFNKRRQELKLPLDKMAPHRSVLIKYNSYFIDQMIAIITSSMVVVYMLYTVDARTVKEFGSMNLMASIPFVYYGIFRYLYLIHQLQIEGDPTRILLSDKKMQINLVLWIVICIVAIYFSFGHKVL